MADLLDPPPRLAARPLPPCAECGTPVRGAFCAACGQKAEALRQPVHHFVRDSFTEFFGLDGRVWRTFVALLFLPGRLSVAYMRGQRQRYLRPLRVYLTSTLLFFLLLSVVDPVGKMNIGDAGRASGDYRRAGALALQTDSVVTAGVAGQLLDDSYGPGTVDVSYRYNRGAGFEQGIADGSGAPAAPPTRDSLATATANPDSVIAAADSADVARALRAVRRARVETAVLRTMPPDSLVFPGDLHDASAVLYPDSTEGLNGPSWLMKSKAVRQIAAGQTAASKNAALSDFMRASVGYIPTVMFLLLPLFALLMKALYARRGWFFAEHIVFGLHTHALAFVGFSAVTLAALVAPGRPAGTVAKVMALAIPFYFVIAMKRVYGQGWGKTLVKAVALGSVYTVLLALGLVAASLLAAMSG